MEWLFSIGLHNVAITTILAVAVWSVTRVWKHAPAAHLLWLLVLVKLVTPPVLNVPLVRELTSAPHPFATTEAHATSDSPRRFKEDRTEPEPSDRHQRLTADSISPQATTPPATASQAIASPAIATTRPMPDETVPPTATSALFPWRLPVWSSIRSTLAWTWLGSAIVTLVVAATRIVRFQRTLSKLAPAPRWLQQVAADLSRRMELKTSAGVLTADGTTPPFVWCIGPRAAIVVPRSLLDILDERQLEMVIAHELAHLVRRDHWVRYVELVAATFYWWNPLVWWARRQLHSAEEECCDAWVAWLFPDDTHRYAESLLQSAESIGSPRGLLTSPFLNKHSLKSRVETVLENRSPRTTTRLTAICLALFAAIMIPAGVSIVSPQGSSRAIADEPPRREAGAGIVDSKKTETSKAADAASNSSDTANQTSSATLQPTTTIDLAEELASFQGVWSYDLQQLWDWPPPIGIGEDGKGRTSEKRWRVTRNQLTWVSQQGERIHASFKLDPFKTPKEIDITFLSGPFKGEKSLGIYESQKGNANALWVCLTNPGTDAPRPTDISASSFKKQTMIGLHRLEEPEPAPLADALERFQGTFMMELCDSVNPTLHATQAEVAKWRWNIKGNELVWSLQGEEWKAKLKIDASRRPKAIDVTYESGPFKGETCLGMYEWGGIDGKSLMIAIQDPGSRAPRPKEIGMSGSSQTSLIFLRPTAETDAANELASLQGKWTLRNYDTAGWPLPGGKGPDSTGNGSELRWTIRGRDITWIDAEGREIHATFTLDSSTSPKRLDLKFDTGPHRGVTCQGIYRRGDVDENILWICLADPDSAGERPTSFSYKRDAGRSFLSLYPSQP